MSAPFAPERARDLVTLLPFDLDRRDRDEQRPGKIAGPADAGLGDRFLGRQLGEPLRTVRARIDGLDGDEVDGAGDAGLQRRRSRSA